MGLLPSCFTQSAVPWKAYGVSCEPVCLELPDKQQRPAPAFPWMNVPLPGGCVRRRGALALSVNMCSTPLCGRKCGQNSSCRFSISAGAVLLCKRIAKLQGTPLPAPSGQPEMMRESLMPKQSVAGCASDGSGSPIFAHLYTRTGHEQALTQSTTSHTREML